MLPIDVLEKLDSMDEYDRMLAYDRIGSDYRMTASEVESQFNAWKGGAPAGQAILPQSSSSTSNTKKADYIQDASRYRPTYDPSREGRSRQSQIEQAVMCPMCHSALGIPSVRPIKVTCPSCMAETTFDA
tara:strand:+ start:147 stop:536 length:390 start_codon:yes stop_codon:yes gene_type:complete